MLESTHSAKGDASVQEPSPAERTVARRTAESRATIPDLELEIDIDAGAALERCRREECTLDALLVAACAAALREVPRANGAYRDGRFELYPRVNVGFVVAAEDAYVIPTVFDADTKAPAELRGELERLVEDARARRLPSPAFSGATFTLWNAGALGVTRAQAIINPPQAAALAAGAVHPAAVVRDGRLEAGNVMTLRLACDHRILYGAPAAAFLHAVGAALER